MVKQSGGLQTIFAIFLGLMVTAFVGVGVYTFYPPPEYESVEIRDLNRQEQAIRNSKAASDLSAADRAQIQELTDRRDRAYDAWQAARRSWGRLTSTILIAFATLVMAVSLVRADQLPVVDNGLLLGGVFTMVYGVGWVIATDRSVVRFIVITVALAITLGLGYVRFVVRGSRPAVGGVAPIPAAGLGDLEQRVRNLEVRVDEAASALGRSNK